MAMIGFTETRESFEAAREVGRALSKKTEEGFQRLQEQLQQHLDVAKSQADSITRLIAMEC